MPKAKILIIDNSIDITGAFKAILQNVVDLRNEFDFHFVISEGSRTISELEKNKIPFSTLRFVEINRSVRNLLLYVPYLLYNAFSISKLVKRHQFSVVHTNDLYNLIGIVVKSMVPVKAVTHVRRMPDAFPPILYKSWAKLHARYSDLILPVSQANAVAFQPLPCKKLSVLYDPLPLQEKYSKYEVKDNDSISLLYLANFTRGKGHEHALHALALLLEKYRFPGVRLNFYGGDFGLQKNSDFLNELKQLAITLRINAHVNFYGKTTDPEKVMKEHDIVLNFSDSESFSRLSLEALFLGVPLIATNTGGTKEMFVDCESGYLVGVRNVDEMASRIFTLCTDYKKRIEFSRNSRKFVVERFGDVHTSGKLKQLYTAVL